MIDRNIQPVLNEPAIRIINKDILVVADLHIGIEYELRELGFNIGSQTDKIINRLRELCIKYKPKDIIFLGDVKHNIPSSPFHERKDIRTLLETIKKFGNIHIIPGNHDGNISKIAIKETRIHSSAGYIIEEICLSHGHRLPLEEIVDCDTLVIAHTHPTIMLTDRLNYKTFEPCWIKANFIKWKFREKFKNEKIPKVLIMPTFNRLCGGIAVNREGVVGPIGKLIDLKNAEVYLLDGTFLGKVQDLKNEKD